MICLDLFGAFASFITLGADFDVEGIGSGWPGRICIGCMRCLAGVMYQPY